MSADRAGAVLDALVRRIDGAVDALGRAAAWLAPAMVLTVALIVALRHGFQTGSIALQESVTYLNALLLVAGAAYTLKEGGHVRVDVLYGRLDGRRRAWVDLIGAVLFLFVTAGFIIWASRGYVAASWRVLEASAESSGLPFVYLLKTAIPALAALLAVQGVSELCKAARRLRAGDRDP